MRHIELAFQVAQTQKGITEIPGAEANPAIVQYHQACTLRATSDEVPWCAAFANWCLIVSGLMLKPKVMRQWCKNEGGIDTPRLALFEKSAAALGARLNPIDQGFPVRPPTFNALARSFLLFGVTGEGKEGEIVVLKRGNDGVSGHVGFVWAISPLWVDVLGGNQSNQVNVTRYPRWRVLGYRR